MKNIILIIEKYLKRFPNEKERLKLLEDFTLKSSYDEMVDWNNKFGHLTVGAFVYCKKEDKFLVLYHRDLGMYLYPGGHVDIEDSTLLDASKRELKEETGLENLEVFTQGGDIIPLDIDIHLIPFNERVNMPEHYHFDFRYLFFIEDLANVNLDLDECKNYKWVSSSVLSEDENFGNVVKKYKQVL